MQTLFFLMIGGLLILVGGCAIPQTTARKVDIDITKSTAITYPAQIRGVYIFKPGDQLKICSEPVPDVAMESLEKLTANLKAKTATELSIEPSLAYELNSKAVELAGRTQLVLLAREMLFRACELSINGEGNPELANQMFTKAIDIIGKMAATDQTRADAARTKADAEKYKAEAELVKAKRALGDVLDDKKKKGGEQ
jgi:hypothetical protein